MKKILPYILMVLIFVNLFAPLTVGLKGNAVVVKKNSVQADTGATLTIDYTATDTSIYANVKVAWTKGNTMDDGGVLLQVTNKTTGQVLAPINVPLVAVPNDANAPPNVTLTGKGTVTIPSLTPSTTYEIVGKAFQTPSAWASVLGTLTVGFSDLWVDPTKVVATTSPFDIPTNAKGNTTPASAGRSQVVSPDSFMPLCGLDDTGPASWIAKGSVFGCAEQFLYYVVFVPTSFIFALSGEFFDSTFAFSVNDTSYRSPFVVQGWGLVRDFCNMFFIFVLLYVAFSTILNVHGFKTKEMIINVVIIGLFMNFSLFATQLIIDTSNIVARVFYNSDTIKITAGPNAANGVTNATNGAVNPDGSLPLSAAIVNKVNPQNLIINGRQAIVVTDNVSNQNSTTDASLSVGTLILITLLAIGVNCVGIFVFVSVGLIFVGRVIGLWIAMILVPFAFFSYTIPAMQSLDMVGWKKWWPETVKLAFMAPVFIFFIYLILEFLNSGLGLYQAQNATGITFVLGIVVPFVFIMMLLLQAKKIAQKMSGELGQQITGGISAAAGLALGGAALGGAVLGRKAIGGTMAKVSQGNTATQKYEAGTATGFTKLRGFVGSKIGLGKVYGVKNPTTGVVTGGLGGALNKSQAHVEHIDHDRHDIDAVKDKRHKGTDIKMLSGTQINNVKTDYIKDNSGRFAADEEEKFRSNSSIAAGTPLTPAQRQTVKDNTAAAAGKDFESKLKNATTAVDGFTRAFTRTNTGTYDVRNLSQTKADKREGIVTKASAALIAGVAMGVRTGLKSSSINHGSGQGDVFKDLKDVFTEALKSAPIKVKVEESHGKGGGDANAGGGGGHH